MFAPVAAVPHLRRIFRGSWGSQLSGHREQLWSFLQASSSFTWNAVVCHLKAPPSQDLISSVQAHRLWLILSLWKGV